MEFEQQRRGRHGALFVSCAGHGEKREQDMNGRSVSTGWQTGRRRGMNSWGHVGLRYRFRVMMDVDCRRRYVRVSRWRFTTEVTESRRVLSASTEGW